MELQGLQRQSCAKVFHSHLLDQLGNGSGSLSQEVSVRFLSSRNSLCAYFIRAMQPKKKKKHQPIYYQSLSVRMKASGTILYVLIWGSISKCVQWWSGNNSCDGESQTEKIPLVTFEKPTLHLHRLTAQGAEIFERWRTLLCHTWIRTTSIWETP